MSEFWPFPLTSYHLSELSFDWVFFLQIQNLSLFYHFPKLLNFSSPGTDTASTKPFLEAGPHWNLQVLSKFYHLTELVFIEKYPYHLSELSYEWVKLCAPAARFYHLTELSYKNVFFWSSKLCTFFWWIIKNNKIYLTLGGHISMLRRSFKIISTVFERFSTR